jgi:hypothetical protein
VIQHLVLLTAVQRQFLNMKDPSHQIMIMIVPSDELQ